MFDRSGNLMLDTQAIVVVNHGCESFDRLRVLAGRKAEED